MVQRKRLAKPNGTANTKVQNGTKLHNNPAVDGRTASARRYREIFLGVGEDRGGLEELSTLEVQAVRRAATLSLLLEDMEGKVAKGESINPKEFAELTKTFVIVAKLIGTDRKAKVVNGPNNLHDYLSTRR